MTADQAPVEPLLRPCEVAALFRVRRSTVARWAADGKLTVIWTPGRHRRFLEREIHALLR
ncbi:helix-turn-helix domain-containing protein [Actinoplanes sp. NBRC 101535]|uniref:helix-turn-helix domain-containing protein n=1 Tax=Actinoplanes sp. NBRC 101535 TaxID=3032196 RepID=UPI0024A029AA|nr:helix-turn-helix domain-containing protein [Actinoplanes sp. NBRC 101535]GLY08242.1 hypothetical protein Acsp01_86210 [Actinoplanes sp. NBRC 101535]